MQDKKIKIQEDLERIISKVDPGHLYAHGIKEYEDEAKLFLERIDASMGEEQLLDIMHKVFQEMLGVSPDKQTREEYRYIITEYLNIKNI